MLQVLMAGIHQTPLGLPARASWQSCRAPPSYFPPSLQHHIKDTIILLSLQDSTLAEPFRTNRSSTDENVKPPIGLKRNPLLVQLPRRQRFDIGKPI